MRITGEDLLRSALAEIAGEITDDQDYEIESAARAAPVCLDTLDQRLLAGGLQGYDVTLPAGVNDFTWEPGGNIDAPPPAGEPPDGGVLAWSWVDGDQEYPRGGLTDAEGYAGYVDKGRAGGPPALLWRNRSGPGSLARFVVLPTPVNPTTLRLYATVPSLRTIERGATYDLPDGVAAYVSSSLAVFMAPRLALPLPDGLPGKAAKAERQARQTTRRRVVERAPREALNIGRGSWRTSLGYF